MRVLIVDEHPDGIRVLRRTLKDHGYAVHAAYSEETALLWVTQSRPALVITDLKMAGTDGVDWCRRLRAASAVPIIILSTHHEEALTVAALDAGADDYLTKPCGTQELLARVRARLRRSGTAWGGGPFQVGDFYVDVASRRVTVRGRAVRLTPREFDLFLYFARHPNRAVPHQVLLTQVWPHDPTAQDGYVRVFILQLRRKLERTPSQPRYLITEHAIGYQFRPRG